MTKKERLETIIAHYSNGKPTVFAKFLGVAPSTISSWLSRDTYDYELLFAKCKDLDPSWLLTGEGEMLRSSFGEPSECKVSQQVSMDPTVGTPFYDVDFFGSVTEIFNDQTVAPACYIIVPGFEKATVWCNVTGHSMEPKISHGDIIALHECTIDDIQYGEIYAVVLDTIRTIKILRRGSSPDTLLYVPINKPDYEDQEFPTSRILKVFEVVGSISKFF